VPTENLPPTGPSAHASTHEDNGDDEISIAGLSGQAADAQTPTNHGATHGNEGGDDISIGGLSGMPAAAGQMDGLATLDDDSHVPPAQLGSGEDPETKFLRGDSTWQTPTVSIANHASTHGNGGDDEISVDALAGVLSDPQKPDIKQSHPTRPSISDGDGEVEVNSLSLPKSFLAIGAAVRLHLWGLETCIGLIPTFTFRIYIDGTLRSSYSFPESMHVTEYFSIDAEWYIGHDGCVICWTHIGKPMGQPDQVVVFKPEASTHAIPTTDPTTVKVTLQISGTSNGSNAVFQGIPAYTRSGRY
jgi:hypothetical protein